VQTITHSGLAKMKVHFEVDCSKCPVGWPLTFKILCILTVIAYRLSGSPMINK